MRIIYEKNVLHRLLQLLKYYIIIQLFIYTKKTDFRFLSHFAKNIKFRLV